MEKKHIDILIIEDSLPDFRLAELMLKESSVPSFGIRHAARLDEALKILGAEPFDIVLMDLDLPDSCGLDGLKKITDRPGSPPVVVLTGLEDEAMGLEALKNKASDFLIKGRLTFNSLIRSILYALTRCEIEQQLVNERRNLQAIFDVANIGMALLDGSGAVQRVNNIIKQWIGKGTSEARDFQLGDILGCSNALSDPAGCGHTPQCRSCLIRKTFETVLSSGQPVHDIETETTLQVNGSQVHLCLAVSADPVMIDGKRHVVLAMNNITRRKEVEDALRRSREDLDRAQAVGQIGSWRLDMGQNTLTWSAEAYRIFGVPEGTPLTYETFLEMIHPDDRQYVDTRWKAALAGEPYDIEHRVVAGGLVKWVREKAYLEHDGAGKLLGGFGISQDITERKRAQEAFLASELQYRRLFESAKDGILILDYETGMVVDVNPFLIEQMGLSREVFLGKKVWELGFFRHIVTSQARFKELQEKDYMRYEDLPLETSDGRKIDVEFVSNVYRVNNSKVIQCNIRDITFRKQAEEVLRRDKETFERIARERTEELWDAQIKLAQSKRLSDIGALAATVAHELRTPLGVIRIGAYNLKRKSTDPALLKHISHIETKVVEADKIISNLLLYSRIKMPSVEEVRLYDLLKECVDHAKENLKGRPIEIREQFDPIRNESLKLDPLQTKEVFHNILANAADALDGHKAGEIKIRAWRRDPEGEIAIAFEDNGVGISESDLKKIPEPFFTTKSKGTGLGLTVCSQIVQNHRGRIEVTSEKDKGAVFTVIFPAGEGVAG